MVDVEALKGGQVGQQASHRKQPLIGCHAH